jgi:hypothetical protein
MSNECLLLVVVHPKAVRGVSANLEHMASRFAPMSVAGVLRSTYRKRTKHPKA